MRRMWCILINIKFSIIHIYSNLVFAAIIVVRELLSVVYNYAMKPFIKSIHVQYIIGVF